MLTLYNNGHAYPLEIYDYSIRETATGEDELIFEIQCNDPMYQYITERQMIRDRDKQWYCVSQIDGGPQYAKVIAALYVDDWRREMRVNYSETSKLLYNRIAEVCPSGWSVVDKVQSSEAQTIDGGDYTPYEICLASQEPYGIYTHFDNVAKTVTLYPKGEGVSYGAFALRSLNLRELDYKGKTSDFCTRLYGYGKDGLSFASINSGKAYVEDFTYSDEIVCGIWRDERYTVKSHLLRDAREKLTERAKPSRSYDCTIADLIKVAPEKYGNQKFELYSVALLIDDQRKTATNYQIVERWEYPYYPERNHVVFSTVPAAIQKSLRQVAGQVARITTKVNTGGDFDVTAIPASTIDDIMGV